VDLKGDEVQADGAVVSAKPPDPEGLANAVMGAAAAGDDLALVGGSDDNAEEEEGGGRGEVWEGKGREVLGGNERRSVLVGFSSLGK